MDTTKFILSIAGFDPSGGAGLTSDIKTFEAHGLYGLSVCTCITVQNDIEFKKAQWVDINLILEQIETLFERFEITVVKIGIVQNWNVLSTIVDKLHQLNPFIKIVLDPVLKASVGFDFHTNEQQNILDKVLEKLFIITPNYEEIQNLYPNLSIDETIVHISHKTNIYLKGGHRTDKKGWDELYHGKIVKVEIPPTIDKVSDKHGSGCVLSSSLAVNIALDMDIKEAAYTTKRYIEHFLKSNTSLLGYHNYSQTHNK